MMLEDIYAKAWKTLAAKEKHKARLPQGYGHVTHQDPKVAERRQKILDFIATRNGVTRGEINAHIETTGDNDLAQLRSERKVHCKRSSNGKNIKSVYYAGPGE